MNPGRIAIATLDGIDGQGGVPTYVRNLAQFLKREGIACDVWEPGKAPAAHRGRGAALFDLLFRQRDSFMYRAESLVRRLAPNLADYCLVHAQDPFVAYLTRQRAPATRLVQTIHGTNCEHVLESYSVERGSKRWLKIVTGYRALRVRVVKRFENAGMASADQLIAVDSNQASLAQRKGVAAAKISIIHNAVDVDQIERLAQKPPAFRAKAPYFFAARRLWPKNGVLSAVRAFLRWVGDKDANLVLAGDGPQRQAIEQELASNPNGGKVILLGAVSFEDIPALTDRSAG